MNEVEKRVAALPGANGIKIKDKMKGVLDRNPGIKILKKLNCVLLGDEGVSFPDDWNP